MRRLTSPSRRPARGLSLIESLVSLLIVSVGMLGLVGLQARLAQSSSDAQFRVVAAGLADRQLSMALVDPSNAACYTVPAQGAGCPPAALVATQAWIADVQRLPSASASASLVTIAGGVPGATGTNRQLRVRIQWVGRAASDVHQLEATTDVR